MINSGEWDLTPPLITLALMVKRGNAKQQPCAERLCLALQERILSKAHETEDVAFGQSQQEPPPEKQLEV